MLTPHKLHLSGALLCSLLSLSQLRWQCPTSAAPIFLCLLDHIGSSSGEAITASLLSLDSLRSSTPPSMGRAAQRKGLDATQPALSLALFPPLDYKSSAHKKQWKGNTEVRPNPGKITFFVERLSSSGPVGLGSHSILGAMQRARLKAFI